MKSLSDRLVPLWAFPKPQHRRWTIHNLMPEGYISLLTANGGTGKSFLALYLGLCVATGRPFFGRAVTRSRVLYLDYELNDEEQKRRLWGVAAGMGISVDDPELAEQMYYLRMQVSIGDVEQSLRPVKKIIEEKGIGVIIIDSMTISAGGVDVSNAKELVPLMQAIEGLGVTTLALDHMPKAASTGGAPASTFGSVFKRNLARSSWMLNLNGQTRTLRQEKSNMSGKEEPIHYRMDLEGEDMVRFNEIGADESTQADMLQGMNTKDVMYFAVRTLHREHGQPVKNEDVVAWRASTEGASEIKTARNHFVDLVKEGKIVRHPDGGYIPASAYTTLDLETTPYDEDMWDQDSGDEAEQHAEVDLVVAADADEDPDRMDHALDGVDASPVEDSAAAEDADEQTRPACETLLEGDVTPMA